MMDACSMVTKEIRVIGIEDPSLLAGYFQDHLILGCSQIYFLNSYDIDSSPPQAFHYLVGDVLVAKEG
jgi:hypothetical protein